ncbi:MAG: hypothetical protein ABH834_02685 [Candidatus Altiarchaeota archaeon]
MPRQKQTRIQVSTEDENLAQHTKSVQEALRSMKVAANLRNQYAGISTVKLVAGDRFGVEGFDAESRTLTCTIKPNDPKNAGVQFRKEFKEKKPELTHQTTPTDGHNTHQINADTSATGVNLTETSLPRPRIIDEDDARTRKQVEWPEIVVPEDIALDLAFMKAEVSLHEQTIGGSARRPARRFVDPPSRAHMRESFEHYFVGSFVDGDDARGTSVGPPLRSLEELSLFEVRGKPEHLGFMISYPFRVEDMAERIVVPVVGDFYGEKGVITGELERQGIVSRVRHEGNPVTIPAYIRSMRQAYIPASGTLNILKFGDREIIPNSEGAIANAWSIVMPVAGAQYFRELIDTSLQMMYTQQGITEPFDDYAAKTRRRLALMMGTNLELLGEIRQNLVAHLSANPDSFEGSVEDHVRLDVPLGWAGKHICGIGIKGPGCEHYDGHHIQTDHLDRGRTPDYIREDIRHGDSTYVHDTRFCDKERGFYPKGLMLSIPHQETGGHRAPVGGDSIVNLLVFDVENQLLKHKAELSVITTAVVPFLSREQVPELSCPQIAIVTNVCLDDTRRIEEWIPGPETWIPEVREQSNSESREGFKLAYKALVVEKYAERPPGNADMTEFTESHFQEARKAHWTRLCTRVGRNINASYNAGLTNPRDQNLAGNISIDGGLADALDLCPMRLPTEFTSFVYHALMPLSEFYETAGFRREDFFTSEHFRLIANETLGEQRGQQLMLEMHETMREGSETLVKATKAMGQFTDAFLSSRGITLQSVWRMDDDAFLSYLDQHADLRSELNFQRSSILEFRMAMTSGRPLYKRDDGRRVRASVSRELDRYRCNADIHLRVNSAMSMEERDQYHEQVFRDIYGRDIV